MYETWSVAQLKEELRKRSASQAGKKAVLVERLESYDRNNLICVEDELEDEMPIIPALDKLRDVNASTKLPALTKHHIQEYAERFQIQPNGRLLYENRCLITLRAVNEDNFTYFQAQCKAQMKKIYYVVTLKLDTNGAIEESNCECAAGCGLEAHCKHVFTVLYGIEDIVRTKTIILHKVCTEQPMAFKKPKKKFFDSPMQADKLPTKKRKLNSVLYSPLNQEDIMANYADCVKNLAIGFGNSKMPFLQTVRPANPYALERDHDYIARSPRDVLLEDLLLKKITQQKIEDVENRTKLQDSCKDWHKLRSVRVTSSNFHSICHSKAGTRQILAQNILYPRKFTSKATTHGKVQEPVAIEKYESFLSSTIDRCGLYISLAHPFLAASPDDILLNETLVEVKCPYTARYCSISPTTVPYLYERNDQLTLKKKHQYYTQIQGQLYCANKKYCNLLVFTFVDMKVIYLERDDEFIQDMVNSLISFYQEHLEPAIINKYLYKYYDAIIKADYYFHYIPIFLCKH